MDDLLQTALVTGGAKRLGATIVRTLGELGFDIAVHFRSSGEEANGLVAELERRGRRAVALAADLANEGDAGQLMQRAREQLGPIGLLVNNAASFHHDRLQSAERSSWDLNIEVNLRTPVILARDYVAQLPESHLGLIINILDQRILNPTPHFLSYSVSKAGLWTATQIMARDLAPRIRVNAVAPGQVLAAPGMSRERFLELVAATPLKRASSPQEIAEAVRFIVRSPSMTGELITIDSGMAMGWAYPRRS